MCLSHLIYTGQQCLIHTCHAMPMPRPCHTLTMPSFLRPRYNTTVVIRPVGYLPAFGFFRLPRGVQRRARHCRSKAGARHGMCELTARHGRGTTWERHGCGIGTACYVWIGFSLPRQTLGYDLNWTKGASSKFLSSYSLAIIITFLAM